MFDRNYLQKIARISWVSVQFVLVAENLGSLQLF
jgi:hypothetical protein